MATRVTLEAMADDRVAVVKTSLSGDRPDRRAEGTWLAKARHRGVVRLLNTTKDPIVLRTLHAGGTTMRTERPTPDNAALLLTDLAVTLADLHDRDLVHGQLTLDHLIIADQRLVLCSPSGTASNPTQDLLGLGACVQALLQRWDETGTNISFQQDWFRLQERLLNPSEGYSARRAARDLAGLTARIDRSRLAGTRGADGAGNDDQDDNTDRTFGADEDGRPQRARSSQGLLIGASLAALAMAGLWLNQAISTGIETTAAGPQVVINSDLYQVTTSYEASSDGDAVIGIGQECGDSEAVIYLSVKTTTIWFFASPSAEPIPLAIVPGGKTLRMGDECQSVWVAGQAGQTELALPS